jgi:hypothetical protein
MEWADGRGEYEVELFGDDVVRRKAGELNEALAGDARQVCQSQTSSGAAWIICGSATTGLGAHADPVS